MTKSHFSWIAGWVVNYAISISFLLQKIQSRRWKQGQHGMLESIDHVWSARLVATCWTSSAYPSNWSRIPSSDNSHLSVPPLFPSAIHSFSAKRHHSLACFLSPPFALFVYHTLCITNTSCPKEHWKSLYNKLAEFRASSTGQAICNSSYFILCFNLLYCFPYCS